MSFEVVTFGSATLDIFAETAKESVVSLSTPEGESQYLAYPSGQKVLIDEFHTEIGGGATNTAACLATLGVPVGCSACVGNDDVGARVLAYLEATNIPFVGSRVDGQTNLSIVLDSKKLHDRTILTYKGSSNSLRMQDLDIDALHATWWYFSSLVGESFSCMIELMRIANERGIAVAFNPSHYQAQLGIDPLREAIELCNLLVLNTEEACHLVGEGSRKEKCRRLREEGAEIVLITDGNNGATLLYGQTLYEFSESRAEHVIETTGAGDCFASTFVAGLTMGKAPIEALLMAAINAESLISKVGPKNGLLDREALLERLYSDNREIAQEKL